jgi:hypothetical protein
MSKNINKTKAFSNLLELRELMSINPQILREADIFFNWIIDILEKKTSASQGSATAINALLSSLSKIEKLVQEKINELTYLYNKSRLTSEHGEKRKILLENKGKLDDYLSDLIGCKNDVGENLLNMIKLERLKESSKKFSDNVKISSFDEIIKKLNNECLQIGVRKIKK